MGTVRPREVRIESVRLLSWIVAGAVWWVGCGPDWRGDNGGRPVPHDQITQPQRLEGELAYLRSLPETLGHAEMSGFVTIDSRRALRCDLPDHQGYREVVEKLGGFRRPYVVPIVQDASTPRLFEGTPEEGSLKSQLSEVADGAPEIQRPNRVGRAGDVGFFLSTSYGLIMIPIPAGAPLESRTSCAMALPGWPRSFLVRNGTILALAGSLDGSHSAIIQFTFDAERLEYLAYEFLENEELIDARLFNDTLAVLTKEFQDDEPPAAAPHRSVAADEMALPSRPLISHRLTVFEIAPALKRTHTETFPYEPDAIPETVEGTRVSSSFNPFLSASGEYLVLSESRTETVFLKYITRSAQVCTRWDSREEPYRFCRTRWKRLPNPDYVAPPPGGVHRCDGELRDCLRRIGPGVAKYIHVPDGETCESGVRTVSFCAAYETRTYEEPIYAKNAYTQFTVYRFHEGSFVKLDDALAVVREGSLEATEDPFRAVGHVKKHDHLRFHGDVFYAVTSGLAFLGGPLDYSSVDYGTFLNTYSIQGNSAIFVDRLKLGPDTSGTTSVAYTDRRVYVGQEKPDSQATLPDGSMTTIDLADPFAPKQAGRLSIPTVLQQLVFLDDALVGVGATTLGVDRDRVSFGTLTQFTPTGVEENSLLLGTDYRYYSHTVGFDDQVLTVDTSLNRILLPYSGSSPFDSERPRAVDRLTAARATQAGLLEEFTLEFPSRPERSLSIADDLAYAFSDRFIHTLIRQEGWTALEIFNGELPSSIYPSRAFPYLIRMFSRTDRYYFELVGERNVASEKILDTLTVPRAATGYCTSERVYFDRDRILIVSEPPGVYFSWKDCPRDGTEFKVYAGYRITETGFDPIDDQGELLELDRTIRSAIRCYAGSEEAKGREIRDFEEIPDEAECYPAGAEPASL